MIDKSSTTFQYLKRSTIVVLIVCVLVFTLLWGYYQTRSSEAVLEVSQIYMSTINERLRAHFETAVSYCLSRLESVVAKADPESVTSAEEAENRLIDAAGQEGFSALSLMGPSGVLEPVYGGNITVLYSTHIISILQQGYSYVGIGILDGRQVELCCSPAEYPMSDGKKSEAVIGVMSDDFLTDILTLDVPGGIVSSYIIRADGTYVLRDQDYGSSYYEDILSQDDDSESAQEYVTALEDALVKSEPFEGSYLENGRTVRVLATPLMYSQWSMLTEMPDGALTEAVSALGNETGWIVICGCGVLAACLLAVLAGYDRRSRKEREMLEMAEAEAVRANKAKSSFFSNMSHDIRTPMNTIVGMTEIALSHIDSKTTVRNALEKIKLSSKQLLGLINDVLDMSRIESGRLALRPELMSLRELTDSIVAIIQPQVEARRQEFDVVVDHVTVENINCDAIRLNQVLLNLLGNAVKFTPEGGKITLSIDESPSGRGDKYIQLNIEVRDTGTGMSEEFIESIFDPYAREESNAVVKQSEGVGLGMAITKFIVERMGGSIEVESVPGKGTTFRVKLDVEKADVPEIEMKLPPMRVLVVDDDLQMGQSTTATLESLGVSAEAVLDGATAVQRVSEADENGEPFDIVLTDWKLPYMNGVQTARKIREEVGEKPIIMMTSAYDWADAEPAARQAGIAGFLSKPLFKSTLYYGLLGLMEETEAQQSDSEIDFGGKRVLVVEDNDLNWEIVEILLDDVHLKADRAEDGKTGVTKFSRSPRGYYAAILMDVHLPVMDGYEATQRIRNMVETRDDAALPIIAMTADAFSDDRRRALEAGMNAHVTKPIDREELMRTLARFIRRKPLE